MVDLKRSELWFVTGSQHLYGPETLKAVVKPKPPRPGIELAVIGVGARLRQFKQELVWNDCAYGLKAGWVS